MTTRQITLIISTVYFVIGNIVGYGIYTAEISSDGFLFYLFIPYTLTWILSSLVGADWLTIIFIIIAFLISIVVFLPIGLYFASPSSSDPHKFPHKR